MAQANRSALLIAVLVAPRLGALASAKSALTSRLGLLLLLTVALAGLITAHPATFAFAFEAGLALAALLLAGLAGLAAARATIALALEVGLAALLPGAAFILLLLLALKALLALTTLLLLTLMALALAALLLLLTVAAAALVLLAVAILVVAFLHVKSPLKVPDLTRWMNAPAECRVPFSKAGALVSVAKRYRLALNRSETVGNNRDCG